MPKRQSHSSQIRQIVTTDGTVRICRPHMPIAGRRRRFVSGASDGLLEWASTSTCEGAKRINLILDLLLKLVDLGRENTEGEKQTFRWHELEFSATANLRNNGGLSKLTSVQQELSSELNHRLLRYKLSPIHWCTIGEFPIIGWWSSQNRPSDPEDPGEDMWFTEQDAIVAIVDLARQGQIHRIRRCFCEDLFYFKFKHQKFCCLRCQQAFYRSSPEYKANRRLYMKNLRGTVHKKTAPKTAKRRK
jgi:hypothetical protein